MNYFSPILPVSFWSSTRNGDVLVTFGILGPLLLTEAVIDSTSLLNLDSQMVSRNDGIEFTKKWLIYGITTPSPKNPNALLWAVERYKILYPSGTTADFAFQNFAPYGATSKSTP